MSIRDQENALFAEWKQTRKGFVADGVVSEEDYLASNPKIAIILKEVNDPEGGDWDLRHYLKGGAGGGGKAWNNIARLVHGIRLLHNGESKPNLKNFPTIDQDFRKETLRSICAINLKKSPGGGNTVYKLLEKATDEDKEYIKKQYAIYDPDLTICGGEAPAYLFRKVLEYTDEKEKHVETRGVWWYERDINKHVIDYYHPVRKATDSYFNGFMDAVREIYKR